ncbi:transcriptional regulator domain protein [Clostridioides difficile DA00062]|nr:transcriptional regulator domain protein [Clostridioides difficile DA00062]
MKKIGDLRLMMKCCSLYYEDNLNQQEIEINWEYQDQQYQEY